MPQLLVGSLVVSSNFILKYLQTVLLPHYVKNHHHYHHHHYTIDVSREIVGFTAVKS
jgi:hypothetical protein